MVAIRILTLLATISTVSLTNGQPYNITNYDTGPGLYYEHVGEASVYNQNFNIITYYDLQKYFLNRDNVIYYTAEIEKLCTGNSHQDCPNFLYILRETRKILEHKHDLIADIVEIRYAPLRRKRFWGGLLTTAVKGIFGIIRNRQKTKAVSEEIEKYRQDVEHLRNMLTHQMYLYQNLQQDVNNKFDELSSEIRKITDELATQGNRITAAEKKIMMTDLLLYTSNIIHLFTTEQSDLLDCLVLARQGILHPIIISPSMLQKKLYEAHNKIENNDILKASLMKAANNSNIMFNMIKPIIYVENMTIVFDFDVPLITESFYDIYKLTSAPVPISENIYAYVYPESPYLFQEKRSAKHFFLDVREFDMCDDAGDKEYVCRREKPLRLKNLTCEHMLVFNDEAMPENCDIRLIKIDETLFIELEREGSWLFTAPNPERLTFYCNQLLDHTEVKGTGIVDVEASCSNTESDTITLRDFSTNNLNVSQHFEIFKPKGNLKKYLENVDFTYLTATMNIRILSRAETVKLRDIGVSLSSIQMRNQLYTGASAQGHNIVLYIVCIVCCVLIVLNVYMYRSFKKSYDVSKYASN